MLNHSPFRHATSSTPSFFPASCLLVHDGDSERWSPLRGLLPRVVDISVPVGLMPATCWPSAN